MSDFSDLIALFAEWRQDIDSVPYAHEVEDNQLVGDLLRSSP